MQFFITTLGGDGGKGGEGEGRDGKLDPTTFQTKVTPLAKGTIKYHHSIYHIIQKSKVPSTFYFICNCKSTSSYTQLVQAA